MNCEPILEEDLPAVAEFLHANMNSRIPVADWERSFHPPWSGQGPDHGQLLRGPTGDVVGVCTAIYSERHLAGRLERFCNLAAWCVLPPFRVQSLGLLKNVLRQKELHFTDLSPQPEVAKIMQRLGFQRLDTEWCVVPNLPWWSGRSRILTDPEQIAARLEAEALRAFEDHRDLGSVRHLAIEGNGRVCHVVYQCNRRRGVPTATVLHLSDPAALPGHHPALGSHFLLRHGALLTLYESRFLAAHPRLGWKTPSPHPKLYRSEGLAPACIDNLYSELVTLALPG